MKINSLQKWRILRTPPFPGKENMRYDLDTLISVEKGDSPPTLRFFRFAEPTVTFGRLQKVNAIAAHVPKGWMSVQRPTGGGLVLHQNDLCLSLCWPKGNAPLPRRAQDQYRWIHTVILEGLGAGMRMAACGDTPCLAAPFETRECFTHSVGYDLLKGDQKIVGGALCCRRAATLYQGSIQRVMSPADESNLRMAFERQLSDP